MVSCDCEYLPTCGGPIYKWLLEEWKEVYRCENHIRLQEEWQIYSHKWYRDFFGPNPTDEERFKKIAKLTFMNEPISCDEWFLQNGNKQSSQESDFKYWGLIV